MSQLRRNIIANYAGHAAAGVIAVVTVPLYLHYLGADGFGLVSFLLALQAVTVVLDFGLSTSANREVSRYRAQQRPTGDRHDLMRTLELFYFCTGLAVFAGLAAVAPWLARTWIKTSQFDPSIVRACLLIGAGAIALRWPTALYHGVLRGAEQQVVLNLANAFASVVRGGGSLLVVAFVTRDVVDFYWWQLVFAAMELGVLRMTVSRHGGEFRATHGRFQLHLLRDLWRFSVNVGALSVLALVLKQLDKLLISRLLPISHLGFYHAATVVSTSVPKIAQPVQLAVFPRLTHLHESGPGERLGATFHRACQLTAFVAAPVAAAIVFFAADLLSVWTGNAELVAQASGALSLLGGAMLFNSMMSVPFSLQLSAGLTWIPLATNAIGVAAVAPLAYWLIQRWGLAGGAASWLVFNLFYFLAVPPVMFSRVLRGHYLAWLTKDTLPFMLLAAVSFGVLDLLSRAAPLPHRLAAMALAALVYAAAMLSTHATLRRAAWSAGSSAWSET